MTTAYPYTREDRIDTPHAYMYTPFEGEPFFAAHAADRIDALADLLERCEAKPAVLPAPLARAIPAAIRDLAQPSMPLAAPASFPASLRQEWFVAGREDTPVLPVDLSAPFETPPALAALITAATEEAAEAWPWLEFFIHRFEVTKRLRNRYNHGPTLAEPMTILTPYAMLAAALGLACRQGLDHKFLNTLLKLGDLISSARHRADRDPDMAGLCAAALVLECLAVRDLMKTLESGQ